MRKFKKPLPLKRQGPRRHDFTKKLLTSMAACTFCLVMAQPQAGAITSAQPLSIEQKRANALKQKPAGKAVKQKRNRIIPNQKAARKSAYAPNYKRDVLPGIHIEDIPNSNAEQKIIPLQFASVGNLARSLPQGLQAAHKGVQTHCFQPKLISLLKTIQNRYKRPVTITSGYRSVAYNKKVKGAEHSLHISCSAADIKVIGIHKSELARFVRSLPNRGGVGTYCHQAVHVDIGSRRDWNWGCGKKR